MKNTLHHIIKVPVVDPAAGWGEKHEIYAAAFGGHLFTARKRNLRRLCFYRCLSVHGGGHVWQRACMAGGGWGCARQGGMHGGGCVWQGACMVGGMRGRGHACAPANTTRYGDAVNEQVVRNLLECILVYDLFLQGQGGAWPLQPHPPIRY